MDERTETKINCLTEANRLLCRLLATADGEKDGYITDIYTCRKILMRPYNQTIMETEKKYKVACLKYEAMEKWGAYYRAAGIAGITTDQEDDAYSVHGSTMESLAEEISLLEKILTPLRKMKAKGALDE